MELTKICSKSDRHRQSELHTHLHLQCNSAMEAIVKQLNIIGDADGLMFERCTPTSLVQTHFLGEVELAKICFNSVRRTQHEIHPCLLLHYTSYSKSIEYQ